MIQSPITFNKNINFLARIEYYDDFGEEIYAFVF